MVAETDVAKKAAVAVRRIIQKVRVATPENFETLEQELAAVIVEHTDSLGDQLAKLQEESDKGLEVARKRIEQIKNQRKKEEEKAQKPKELLKELDSTFVALEAKTTELQEKDFSSCDQDEYKNLIEELVKELANFTKVTLKHGTELRAAAASLPTIAQEYKKSSEKSAATRKAAETVLAKSKAAVKAAEAAKAKAELAAKAKAAQEEKEAKSKKLKEQLESAKPEIEEQIKDAEELFRTAAKDIETAESIVYPFSKGRYRNDTEAEIIAACDEADSAISLAQSTVDEAAEKKPKLGEDDFEEAVKKELEAMVKTGCKKLVLRNANLQARLRRCKQLVKSTRGDVAQIKIDKVVGELKAKLLSDIEPANDLSPMDEPLKLAEEQVKPFAKALLGKVTKESENEMSEKFEEATSSIEHVKELIVVAKAGLCPVDDSLDEDVKKELRRIAAKETKETVAKLEQIEKRLQRAEGLVSQFNARIKKLKQAEEIEALKPALLEKVREGTNNGALSVLEELIQTAESLVIPFYRGCKADPSEFESLANAASEAVEKAQAAVNDAQQESSAPIDETLDEDIKKELLAFIAPELKKPKIRLGQLCRRIRRASQIVKSFRIDMTKEDDNKLAKVKAKAVKIARDFREKQGLSSEDFFAKFSPAEGLVDEAGFQKFYKQAGDDTISEEDSAAIFKTLLPEGSSNLSEDDIKRAFCPYLKVVAATVLTDDLPIGSSKALKQLKIGQILELLEAPKMEAEGSKVQRARVKTLAGGAEGWATVVGSAGTVFLKPCPAPAAKEKGAK